MASQKHDTMKSLQLIVLAFLSFFNQSSAFTPLLLPLQVRTRPAPPLPVVKGSLLPWQQSKIKETPPSQLVPEEDKKKPSPLIQLASSPIGALAALSAIVLFHESGHYLTARGLGVKADEFSIGFGPKLLGFEAFGDDFSFRLLPMGGYVSLPLTALAALSWQQRVLILSAGVLCNLLLAFLIYWGQIVFGPGLPKVVFEPGVVISGLAGPDAPASGFLQKGDVIVGIKNKPLKMIASPTDFEVQRTISNLISTTQATPEGESLQLTVQRGSKTLDVNVTPRRIDSSSPPSMGVFLQPNFVGVEKLQTNSPLEAASLASQTVATMTTETAIGLATFAKDLISGKAKSSEYRISGPVRVVERASEVVATKDWNNVLKYIAAASVNIGVLNIFPVPPSDGFQILMTMLQAFLMQHAS